MWQLSNPRAFKLYCHAVRVAWSIWDGAKAFLMFQDWLQKPLFLSFSHGLTLSLQVVHCCQIFDHYDLFFPVIQKGTSLATPFSYPSFFEWCLLRMLWFWYWPWSPGSALRHLFSTHRTPWALYAYEKQYVSTLVMQKFW